MTLLQRVKKRLPPLPKGWDDTVLYYLVRAENACGVGSPGLDPNEIDRDVRDCSP